jgi:signal transduction histidine kinase
MKEVLKSTDEVLFNRKTHIVDQFRRHADSIAPEGFNYMDFVIIPSVNVAGMKDLYSDTLIFETVDQDWDEFRKLASGVEIKGRSYRLEIVVPRLETHEIVETIVQLMVVVFILMVGVFYFTTRYFSRRLWQPFYDTLQQLNDFEIDGPRGLELTPGRIEEFTTLNNSITDLTERTRSTFTDQKQFIENASHEMQTPLAITQSKLELLIEDPHLTEHQSEIVQTLINSTQRLAKLNKTLLLLSKIENQQFLEKEPVHLQPLIREILTNFEEQEENLKITVDTAISNDITLQANRSMVDLLLTNLIKNAFFHNVQNGSIHIVVSKNRFSISNTSGGETIPEGKLFQRFYKQSTNKESWGLGLAMVKKICDINQWKISYSKPGSLHAFVVVFPDGSV